MLYKFKEKCPQTTAKKPAVKIDSNSGEKIAHEERRWGENKLFYKLNLVISPICFGFTLKLRCDGLLQRSHGTHLSRAVTKMCVMEFSQTILNTGCIKSCVMRYSSYTKVNL